MAEANGIPTPKRSASPLQPSEIPEAKRSRLHQGTESQSQQTTALTNGEVDTLLADQAVESSALTQHHQIRCTIQRSIALVLKHDGFQSATPEAMESFTSLVEACMFRPHAPGHLPFRFSPADSCLQTWSRSLRKPHDLLMLLAAIARFRPTSNRCFGSTTYRFLPSNHT
jgi:hypothetical protein